MSLEREIAVMIVEALNLDDISFDDIDTKTRLFNGALYLNPVRSSGATVEFLNNKNIL